MYKYSGRFLDFNKINYLILPNFYNIRTPKADAGTALTHTSVGLVTTLPFSIMVMLVLLMSISSRTKTCGKVVSVNSAPNNYYDCFVVKCSHDLFQLVWYGSRILLLLVWHLKISCRSLVWTYFLVPYFSCSDIIRELIHSCRCSLWLVLLFLSQYCWVMMVFAACDLLNVCSRTCAKTAQSAWSSRSTFWTCSLKFKVQILFISGAVSYFQQPSYLCWLFLPVATL